MEVRNTGPNVIFSADDGMIEAKAMSEGSALASIIIAISLIALAFSRRSNFLTDIDEEKDIEKEEMHYCSSIKKKGV